VGALAITNAANDALSHCAHVLPFAQPIVLAMLKSV
jgi:hypothetical protein